MLIEEPTRSAEHPTMKPVALLERFVLNSTTTGDTVLDPFAGSGSALMACEKLERVARLMEIDPLYVDVTIARWEKFTGKKAKLAGSTTADTWEKWRRWMGVAPNPSRQIPHLFQLKSATRGPSGPQNVDRC
jgi:hypothetical protein